MVRAFYRASKGVTVVMVGYMTGISRKKKEDKWSKVRGIAIAFLNMKPFSSFTTQEQDTIIEYLRKDGTFLDINDMLLADIFNARYRYIRAISDPKRSTSCGHIAVQIAKEFLDPWVLEALHRTEKNDFESEEFIRLKEKGDVEEEDRVTNHAVED